jgi:hypothetical protein
MADVATREEREPRLGVRHLVLPTLVVFAVTLALYGWPVPRLSEELYLPLVRRAADPSYLRGDWIFAGAFGEHWLFDHLFAPFAEVLSINSFGWLGRLIFWPALGLLLIRVGNRFGLTPWAAAGAVSFWLFSNQSLVGSEWILGSFEAKTVAYVCFLGAILAVTSKRIPLGLALVGLTISFHPAVGMWSAFGAGIALLVLPETRRETLRWCWLAVLFAVPGVIGALSAVGEASDAMQRFVVREVIPYHTDPFFGGKTWSWGQVLLHTGLLLAMFAFNLWAYTRSKRDLTQRFFAVFQIVAAVPFALAYIARALHVWSYLRLMPLRSFPLMVPLIFFYQAFVLAHRLTTEPRPERTDRRRARRNAGAVIAVALVIAIFPTNPVFAGPRMIRRNIAAWTTVDQMAEAFDWVRENTPKDARCVFPVDRQDVYDRAERASISNWQAIPYDRLQEWKIRIDQLVGGASYFDGPEWHGDLPDLRAAYNRLTTAQIDAIAKRYNATCLVTQTEHPYELLHRNGDVRVYALQPR